MGKQRWWLVALIVLVLAAGLSYFALPWRIRQLPPGPATGTEVTLYFVNREYVTTGNEELPKLLPFTRRIEVQENGGTGRENLVTDVLAELRKPPAGEAVTTALRDDLRINGVRVEETTVYVDFSSDNLHGGSLEEILLVEQVVTTLTGLPGLEKVQFCGRGTPGYPDGTCQCRRTAGPGGLLSRKLYIFYFLLQTGKRRFFLVKTTCSIIILDNRGCARLRRRSRGCTAGGPLVRHKCTAVTSSITVESIMERATGALKTGIVLTQVYGVGRAHEDPGAKDLYVRRRIGRMEYFLNEVQLEIKELAHRIAEEKVRPVVRELDETGEFPWEIMKVLADADLFGVYIPEEYGGLGGGVMEQLLVVEELSRVCSGVAVSYAASGLGAFPSCSSARKSRRRSISRISPPGRNWPPLPSLKPMPGATRRDRDHRHAGRGLLCLERDKTVDHQRRGSGDLYGHRHDRQERGAAAPAPYCGKGTPGFPLGKKRTRWDQARPPGN